MKEIWMTYGGELRQHYTKTYQYKVELSKTQKPINQSKGAIRNKKSTNRKEKKMRERERESNHIFCVGNKWTK